MKLPHFLGVAALGASLCLATAAEAQDRAVYRPRPDDPVLRELRKRAKARQEARRKQTEAIDKRHAEAKKSKRKTRRALLFDLAGVAVPPSPQAFKRIFHFAPVAQYRTGTCWAFASTSFVESEVARLTGQHIKLSEMHTVYYEYLDKARRWLRERGHSEFSEDPRTTPSCASFATTARCLSPPTAVSSARTVATTTPGWCASCAPTCATSGAGDAGTRRSPWPRCA